MTKKELIAMLNDANDNDTITFVINRNDRDGFGYDIAVNVYKVIAGEIKTEYKEYGIKRIVKA